MVSIKSMNYIDAHADFKFSFDVPGFSGSEDELMNIISLFRRNT